MKSISPKAHFRQRVIKYSVKNGVTAASIRYRVCRKAIYDWKKRYDGRWQSLIDRSHRPHSHPRQQTAEEYAMIERYYRRTKDKMMLWDKLRENGYTRCYNSLLRAIKRLKLEETPEKRKGYKPKPYKRADYPGQKVQIDVKFVPAYCVANGQKYYQYTAVDECTRFCFREMYDEHIAFKVCIVDKVTVGLSVLSNEHIKVLHQFTAFPAGGLMNGISGSCRFQAVQYIS